MLCVLNRPPARFPCRRCFAFISGTRQICDRVCGTAAVIVLWLCKIASIICRSVYSELRIISTGRFLLIILIGILVNMKNLFLLSSLMSLVLVFMPSCGLQSDESHPNDNIVSESLDLLPSVSDESAALDAPEWVAWLANSWGDNSGEWMSEAECDGKDIELWLRENPQYGETSKCWSLETAISTLGIVKMDSDNCPLSDEALRNSLSELLAKQLISELSTPNPQRTFEFIDCKNLSVSVNWNDEAAIWVCTISAEVSYNGIILPYGAVPQSNYLTLPLGTFELNCSDNTIFLIPVYSDTLQRIII